MRFDVVSLGDHIRNPYTGRFNETQAGRFAMIVDLAVLGEELGFSGAWIGEHHASDYIVSNPQMLLAAVAVRTKRVRLGTAVSLLANADAVRIAEDFATLDLLSNGRAELGIGSGITEHTFQLFGQDIEKAAEIGAEKTALLTRLWTEREVTWSGEFRSPIIDTRIEPRTFSGKPIPITVATGGTEATARRAGLSGHKLALLTVIGDYKSSRPIADIYRAAYREAGHDPAGMSVSVTGYCYLEEDGKRAREHWAPHFQCYMEFTNALRMAKGFQRSIEKRVGQLGAAAFSPDPQMCGSPAEIVDKISKAYDDIGGFDELKLVFDHGAVPQEEVARSMRLFAENVMPKLNFK
jgi:alkanesulfonate monooxygenase SsuD/methylene tetrahydromethanopterin reductase-like flavin-dependent oxidoreductase (luciferase family)